ncbi:DNA polymerase III subunit delta' [Metabacillus halosaccharovorans]|uniref:DNA polymerase III subunit delta' n=1 Tax=Metabacillus halosaccharovorans TaxID=930124 RepID=A0ABT3DC23_9BACI|nr:DNA polymerase III subunit delta' [Metabacillus halosaccharovorans]MCV9884615.1 DNA polymerase III subunit delta' [Metabacillus halosaccharovorans]
MTKSLSEFSSYQPRVIKLLTNSIRKDRLAHAYLFEGKKGTGKREVGVLLAKSFFCENLQNYEPCDNCRNCKRIESGNHPDVHVVEPDGLSIKKGQIQALQEEFSKSGVESNKKLYMIVHADKMTVNAANSLLKFLEEPNANTIAILITEQYHKILNTILSRCQLLSFQPLQPKAIEQTLTDSGIAPPIASLVAQLTNDTEAAFNLSKDDWFAQARLKVIKLYEVLTTRKGQAPLYIHTEWMNYFNDKEKQETGLDLLLYIYKDVLSVQLGNDEHVIYQDIIQQIKQHALQITQRSVTEKVTSILEAKKRLHANVNPQLLMEQLVLTLQEG